MLNSFKFTVFVVFILSFIGGAARGHAFEVYVSDKLGKPTKDVVIALFPQDEKTRTTLPDKIASYEIMQKNYEFSPRFLVVQKGSILSFPNRDRSQHHLYSFSETKSFELPLYRGDSPDVLMDKEGVVPIGCNIHDWMKAYLVIVDTPLYMLSGEDGRVDFGKIPKGLYTMKFWHFGMDIVDGFQVKKDVNIEEGGDLYQLQAPMNNLNPWPRKPTYIEKQY